MKFSPDKSPRNLNHRRQGYYQANILHYLREIGEREKYPAEEEHRRDKQSEIVIKAVK